MVLPDTLPEGARSNCASKKPKLLSNKPLRRLYKGGLETTEKSKNQMRQRRCPFFICCDRVLGLVCGHLKRAESDLILICELGTFLPPTCPGRSDPSGAPLWGHFLLLRGFDGAKIISARRRALAIRCQQFLRRSSQCFAAAWRLGRCRKARVSARQSDVASNPTAWRDFES